MVIVWLLLACIPLGLSLWALLDAARRPAWAWSFANKSQLGWLMAILLGTLMLGLGVIIAVYYLWRVRPVVRAIEDGNFDTA